MKSKYLLSISILGFGLVVSAFIVTKGVSAQTPPAGGGGAPVIQYPVPELGNCGSESSCRTYCDDAANSAACLSFAGKYNLMSPEEVQLAKNFEKSGKKGPGGCTGKEQCETFCNNITNINECVAFAEENNLMSPGQLAEAKQVQAAIAKGAKPPACGSKNECNKYCNEAEHFEECIKFGEAAGFITPEEAKNTDKMIAAIKKGAKPPACNGREDCSRYCREPAHTEECIAFSEAAGMMTSQEAAMVRKTGGKGPGGCTDKEQCDAFCNDSANQETCISFGRENGLISPEELQKMEEGKKQFTSSLSQAPAKVLDCISGMVGADRLEKFKSGAMMPPRDMGDKIGECFRQGMSQGGPPGDQNGQSQPWADMCENNTELACVDGAGNFLASAKVGSDGSPVCPENSTAKCGNYPENNQQRQGQGQDQRGQFQPGQGNMNPGGNPPAGGMLQQSGPGGCKTPEECQSFCMSNPEVCRDFRPSGEPQQGDQNQNNRGEMMQGIQPGAPMQGQYPTCPPGAQCGPGPNMPGQAPTNQPGTFNQGQPGSFVPSAEQIQQMQQQFQQQQQEFQSPPPTGGSFLQVIGSFIGL